MTLVGMHQRQSVCVVCVRRWCFVCALVLGSRFHGILVQYPPGPQQYKASILTTIHQVQTEEVQELDRR